jgi:hypothetical protein
MGSASNLGPSFAKNHPSPPALASRNQWPKSKQSQPKPNQLRHSCSATYLEFGKGKAKRRIYNFVSHLQAALSRFSPKESQLRATTFGIDRLYPEGVTFKAGMSRQISEMG